MSTAENLPDALEGVMKARCDYELVTSIFGELLVSFYSFFELRRPV